MLETIREFGLECLESCGELEAAHTAHATYYLRLSEETAPHLRGPKEASLMAYLEIEQENLYAALSFLLEQPQGQAETPEGRLRTEQALRLCVALYWFWFKRGSLREGQVFLERALARPERVAPALRARALYAAAELAHGLDELERTETLCGECLFLYRELGDTLGIASCLELLGSRARVRGHYALACSLLEEAEGLFEQLGDRWNQGRCHVELARTATEQGQYERAHTLLEANLQFCQQAGDQVSVHWVEYLLARTLFLQQADLARVSSLVEQSLAFFQELGYGRFKTYALSLLGRIRLVQGEVAQAGEWLEESLLLVQEVGDREGTVEPLLTLSRVALAQGDPTTARRRYQEVLAILREMGSQAFLAAYLEGLAALETAQGTPRQAARLWGTAEVLREVMGTPLHPVERATDEQVRAEARAALGEQAWRQAWAEGRRISPEQALAAQEQAMTPTALPARAAAAIPLPPPSLPFGLTAREVEVLGWLSQGLSDAQIAEQLVISVRTVNRHTTTLYSKLGVSSRAAATRAAIEHHLL